MVKHFTLEYWKDAGQHVGKLKDVPGVFSQGESLQELEDNIRDVYHLMQEETEVLTLSFYRLLCGSIFSFPQWNRIAILQL